MHRARAAVRLELLVRIACVGWRASETRGRSGRERAAGEGERVVRGASVVVPSGSGHAREPRGSGRGTTRKHEGTHETYRGRRAWSLGAFTSSAALSARTPMAREELTIFKCLQVQLWYGTPGYGDNARMSNRRRNVEHFDRYFGRTRHFVTRDLARVSSIAFTLSDSFPHISIDASTSSASVRVVHAPVEPSCRAFRR